MGGAVDMSREVNGKAEIAIAYVSLVVPDTQEFENPAVHPLGVGFMRNVLIGLRLSAEVEVESFSAEPIPSFPRSKRLFVRGRNLRIADGLSTRTVTFVNVTPLKQLHIGLSMLWHLVGWGIRSRGKKQRVVFTYNISVPPLAFTLVAAFLARAKLMAFIGDINVPGETVPDNLLCRLDAWLGRRLLKYVEGAIVVSDAIAKEYLPGRPSIRLDGGVTRQVVEETGHLLDIRQRVEGRFTIVATGSLRGFNGIKEILAAFALLHEPWYRLIVAGRGPLATDVEVAAASDSRIEFRGFMDHEKVLALHAEADVLLSMRIIQKLNTSLAFPGKTFEYLLSGVPVITTATGHMKEEYGPYCFVLSEDTPEALATMLRHVESLGRDERERVGRTARKFIINNKSWDLQHSRIAEYVHSTLVRC
jgi:glycosyltransferase involved in cell wall biosynthesis